MKSISPELIKLRDQLRKLDRSGFTVIKSATIGGEQDMPFEQAFSNLAHAYIKDKAPTLQDYEVGFQLLERNEDNTKAVGVFGFKVGTQWIYAPVFFLNGDLKGHELLYIKNQDMFVPLKENWLNYILNRKPNTLGKSVDKNLSLIGVQPPNFYQISRSPAKYASVMNKDLLDDAPDWLKPVLPDFAYMATTSPDHDAKFAKTRTFLDLVKDAGHIGIMGLVDIAEQYPKVMDAAREFYGDESLNEAVKQAAANQRLKDSVLHTRPIPLVKSAADLISGKQDKAKSKLRIYKSANIKYSEDLSDDDRKDLLSGKVVVKDERTDRERSVAYDSEAPEKLFSPGETGLYEVLTSSNEFAKCLVVFGPYSHHGREKFVTVVDVKSKSWINHHPSEVFVKHQYSKAEFDEWFDKLPDTKLSSGGGLKMVMLHNGQSTLPLNVSSSTQSGKTKSYNCYFRHGAVKERAGSFPVHHYDGSDTRFNEGETLNNDLKSCCFDNVVTISPFDGTKIRYLGKEIVVPSNHKVLSLDKSEKENEDESESHCNFLPFSSESEKLKLGTPSLFYMNLIKESELKDLTIRYTGSHYQINDGKSRSKDDAFIDLIQGHGFGVKQANDMLSLTTYSKKQRYLVKYAGPEYEMQRNSPSMPPIPEPQQTMDSIVGGQVPTQPGQTHNIPVPGTMAMNYDRSVYDPRPQAYTQANMIGGKNSGPDQKAMQMAMEASQNGQKEVFDTSMMSSLLKNVRDDTMVNRYMGDLMKGMDRLGRILFLFYWRQEEFEERYGKDDMSELEDSLRNAFESMGDIVLFLKQKTIEPYPDEVGDIDLGSIANQ